MIIELFWMLGTFYIGLGFVYVTIDALAKIYRNMYIIDLGAHPAMPIIIVYTSNALHQSEASDTAVAA